MSISRLQTVVLLITIWSTGMTGCYRNNTKNPTSKDEKPFFPDRVVTVRITMSEEDWESSRAHATDEQYVKADLSYDGKLVQDIAVRPKGNSSLMVAAASNTPRFSLKVDFNYYNPDLNLYGIKKLNFNNGFSDPTLIREFLGYELFRQMGVPASRASFADLWVNDTHLGLYTMVEQVDETFLGNNYDNRGNLYKPGVQAASLSWTEEDLKKEQSSDESTATQERVKGRAGNMGRGRPGEIPRGREPEARESNRSNDLPGFMPQGRMMLPGGMRQGEDSQLPDGFQPPEGLQLPEGLGPMGGMMAMQGGPGGRSGDYLAQMDLKTNEDKPDHSLLFRLLDILNNEPDATFPDEIEKVLDVDNILRFLAVSVAMVHLDNYIGLGHNYYLYENNGKFVIIPWDLNMVFGTFNMGLDRDQLINYYIDEPTSGSAKDKPLVNRLLSYEPYLDAYHGYLEEFLDGPFNVDRMSSRIDEIAELVRPFVVADELKFFTNEEFERGLEKDLEQAKTQRFMPGALMKVMGLKIFVIERSESIRKQLNGSIKSRSDDGSGNGGNFGFTGFMR